MLLESYTIAIRFITNIYIWHNVNIAQGQKQQ